ncbi:MAG: hypothetical protein EOP06_02130 [Proteobacteria bacterium]|nr:MAG: hypothetical protein EOP06_02130 [Pseudomonadota bacterium]
MRYIALIFILTFTAMAHAVEKVGSCKAIFAEAREIFEPFNRDITKPWMPSDFSDPTAFDPSNFRFVVHSFGGSPGVATNQRIESMLVSPQSSVESWNLLAGSVISNDRVQTWTPYGLILEVPQDNFLAAHTSDMGSGSVMRQDADVRRKTVARLMDKFGLPSPNKLLVPPTIEKQYSRHNEILMQPIGPSGRHIKVSGVFLTRRNSVIWGDPKVIAIIRKHASLNKLPIVVFDETIDAHLPPTTSWTRSYDY